MLAAALVVSGPATASAKPVASSAEVERVAKRAMSDTGARGLAIAIIDRGKVKSVQSFGERNAKGEPLTPDTIMYGASLTKAVFGYYVAMQAGRGKIDLDHPIAAMLEKPLPDYGNLDAYGNWGDLAEDPRWKTITPRMTLNHTTGFANFSFLEPDQKLRIHFRPGSRYGYSGEGIMLLQFGLEIGLGLKLGDELDRELFLPLGMTNTSLMWRADFAANLADGWKSDGSVEPHDERSRVRAAGSMDTSITDMAKMTAAMVSGWGQPAGKKSAFATGGLTITTRSQFPSLQAEAPANDRPNANAALGVIAFNGPQGRGFYKGGHNDSTANSMVCVFRRQRCVVIMANDVRAEAAFPAIVRDLLGETGVPYAWEYPELFRTRP
jgi:CubicO group peptidase (beta-lactamase class C family)